MFNVRTLLSAIVCQRLNYQLFEQLNFLGRETKCKYKKDKAGLKLFNARSVLILTNFCFHLSLSE